MFVRPVTHPCKAAESLAAFLEVADQVVIHSSAGTITLATEQFAADPLVHTMSCADPLVHTMSCTVREVSTH